MLNVFAKRRLEKLVRDYLIPADGKDMLEGSCSEVDKIQTGRIEFTFAFVRAETSEQLSKRVGLVADAGVEHEALVHHIVGPMVIMAHGTLGPNEPSSSRQQLVNHLEQQFGADIKIVHGAVDGHFGSFGGERRVSYTFTFPRFDHVLVALGRLEFGRTEEFIP